jgi:hypothetical protein
MDCLHNGESAQSMETLEQELLVIELEVKQEAHFLEELEKLLHEDMGSMAKELDSEYAQFCYNELCAITRRRRGNDRRGQGQAVVWSVHTRG